MEYRDRKGVFVREGDILFYDEGEGGGKSIEKIVCVDKVLYGEAHFYLGKTKETELKWQKETELMCWELKLYTIPGKENLLVDMLVIGSVDQTPELLDFEYVQKTFAHYEKDDI